MEVSKSNLIKEIIHLWAVAMDKVSQINSMNFLRVTFKSRVKLAMNGGNNLNKKGRSVKNLKRSLPAM